MQGFSIRGKEFSTCHGGYNTSLPVSPLHFMEREKGDFKLNRSFSPGAQNKKHESEQLFWRGIAKGRRSGKFALTR